MYASGLSAFDFIGTLSNGYKLVDETCHQKHAVEVMIGMYSNSENFTNNPGRWGVYFSSNNDEKLADLPHKGFKPLQGLGPNLVSSISSAWEAANYSGQATLYNWQPKILLVNMAVAENKNGWNEMG